MNVYIEYVIIDNLVITTLISLVSYRILKSPICKLRVALSASVGTAAAILYPFIQLHTFALFGIKAALYFLICMILYYKKQKLARGATIFFVVTALFGGILFMFGYFAYDDITLALTLPAFDFPLGVILLIVIAVYVVGKRTISMLIKYRSVVDYSFEFEFCALGKTVKATGFLDSGNLLFDDKSGLPVVVIGARLTANLLDNEQLTLMLKGSGEKLTDEARYLPFGTLSSGGKILVLKAQKFRLYLKDGANILKDVMLGLSLKPLGEFEALLSPAIF